MQNNNQTEIIFLKDLGLKYATKKSKQRYRYALYKCHCGNEFECQVRHIKTGNSKSCGCNEGNKKHRLRYHRLYYTWSGMIQRCTNSNNPRYSDYGGRGITVCQEWLDINNFINDMDSSFKEGLSIDRINPNGNYEPNNCRWATKSTQSRNQRQIRVNNKTGYRGVSIKRDKYSSTIRVNGKLIYLGIFANPIDGALAYDNYIIDNNLEHTRNFNS